MGKRQILLIGPLPPPNGGVSIHVHRLAKMLSGKYVFDFIDESKMVKPEYFNFRRLQLVRYLKKLIKSDLVYIHSGTPALQYFHIVAGKITGSRVMITLHAYPFKKKWLPRILDRILFSLANEIILVNPLFKERISLPAKKCSIQNAFIPPIMEEESCLPDHIAQWIKTAADNNHKVICSNAWRLDVFNNEDLYGLDLCIEVTDRLLKKGYLVKFIFNIATIDKYAASYKQYQEKINSMNLDNHFLLINEQLSFVRLMEQSDVFVRPTNTDGDSLSIRESLFLGRKTLASDVVQRPAGTILFKNRDIDDFEEKLQLVLKEPLLDKSTIHEKEMENYISYYGKIIDRVLN